MAIPINETRRAYRAEEVAELLGVSRSTVYRLMGEGLLASVKVGGSRRITLDQLNAYVSVLQKTA